MSKAWARRFRPPGGVAPDSGGGAVAKEAGAQDHAGIVVEVEGGGAYLDGDAGDGSAGVGGEETLDGAKGRDRGATAEADEVREVGVGAEAELLGDVAGDAGAKVAGASADDEGVDIGGGAAGGGEGGREGGGGERWSGVAELGVEFIGIQIEDTLDVAHGEVTGGDAGLAAQDGAEDELGAPA